MIKIGYCASGTVHEPYLSLASHPVFHPKREELPVRGKATRCPAFAEYVASAFNIHIPYDLAFRIRKTPSNEVFVEFDRKNTSLPENALGSCIVPNDIDDGVIQLSIHPFWIFISDTPDVIMTVQGAQQQTNPDPIRGQFNIYNWFRGTSYAFKAEVDQEITISKDSPIYQVKFYHPTETNFTVSECYKNDFITARESGQHLHGMIGKMRWSNVFDFNKKRRPAKVLNFIDEDGK